MEPWFLKSIAAQSRLLNRVMSFEEEENAGRGEGDEERAREEEEKEERKEGLFENRYREGGRGKGEERGRGRGRGRGRETGTGRGEGSRKGKFTEDVERRTIENGFLQIEMDSGIECIVKEGGEISKLLSCEETTQLFIENIPLQYDEKQIITELKVRGIPHLLFLQRSLQRTQGMLVFKQTVIAKDIIPRINSIQFEQNKRLWASPSTNPTSKDKIEKISIFWHLGIAEFAFIYFRSVQDILNFLATCPEHEYGRDGVTFPLHYQDTTLPCSWISGKNQFKIKTVPLDFDRILVNKLFEKVPGYNGCFVSHKSVQSLSLQQQAAGEKVLLESFLLDKEIWGYKSLKVMAGKVTKKNNRTEKSPSSATLVVNTQTDYAKVLAFADNFTFLASNTRIYFNKSTRIYFTILKKYYFPLQKYWDKEIRELEEFLDVINGRLIKKIHKKFGYCRLIIDYEDPEDIQRIIEYFCPIINGTPFDFDSQLDRSIWTCKRKEIHDIIKNLGLMMKEFEFRTSRISILGPSDLKQKAIESIRAYIGKLKSEELIQKKVDRQYSKRLMKSLKDIYQNYIRITYNSDTLIILTLLKQEMEARIPFELDKIKMQKEMSPKYELGSFLSGLGQKEEQKTTKNEQICGICLSEIDISEHTITLLTCSHSFHSDCLDMQKEHQLMPDSSLPIQCAFCNTALKLTDLHRLFKKKERKLVYKKAFNLLIQQNQHMYKWCPRPDCVFQIPGQAWRAEGLFLHNM